MPFVELKSTDIYYEDFGSGAAIVLNAGGVSPATSMRPLVDRLSNRYRVIIWDRPNQGASQISIRGQSSVNECGELLCALIEHLGAAPAYVAGASEGGRVAFRAALLRPDLIGGLFLWQVSVGPVAEFLRQWNYERYAQIAETEGMEGVTRTPFYAERIKMNPDNRGRLLALDPQHFASVLRQWEEELREEDPILAHTAEDVRKLSVPTVVVGGVDDNHPYGLSKALADLIPGSRFLEAPYTLDEWEDVVSHVVGAPNFNLYAALPGIASMIDSFVADVEAGTWSEKLSD